MTAISAEPSPTGPDAPPRKLRRRIVVGCLGVAVVALTAALIFLVPVIPNLIDDPPYVAPDLVPTHSASPEEGNFARVLLEELGGEEVRALIDQGEELIDQYCLAAGAPDRWSEEFDWSAFLASEVGAEFSREAGDPARRLIDRLTAQVDLPYCEFPAPDPKWVLERGSEEFASSATVLQRLAELREWDLRLAERGDLERGIETRERWLRIAARFVGVRNGNAGEALSRLGFIASTAAAVPPHLPPGADSEALRRLLDALRPLGVERESISHAIRVDFEWVRVMVEDTHEALQEGYPFERKMLLPNRTLREIGEYYRAGIREGESTGRVTVPLPGPWVSGEEATLRNRGNPIGYEIIRTVVVSLDVAYRAVSRMTVSIDLARLQLALRIHELESGALPEALGALVPELFDELPIDPHSQEPYRYDPARRIVWSVGEDGVDNGGSTEIADWAGESEPPDIVATIPGGE